LALNESFNIVASIKNLGQEAADGYYLDVYYDNDYGRGGPDNITAGEVQEWYVGPLTASAGTHTTHWVVDPDNLIAELDESNNQKDLTFTIGGEITTTATTTSASATTNSTSTTTSSTSSSTPAATESASTPTTITVQTTQVVTATGTTTVTGYMTVTVISYTGTQISTSTIVVPATGTAGPPALTSTGQTMQVLTSTRTTTVTSYTTTTLTSYTRTRTLTSTKVVTRPAAASTHMAYLGFLSLFAATAGQMATAGSKGWRIRKRVSHLKISTVSTLRSLSLHLVDDRDPNWHESKLPTSGRGESEKNQWSTSPMRKPASKSATL